MKYQMLATVGPKTALRQGPVTKSMKSIFVMTPILQGHVKRAVLDLTTGSVSIIGMHADPTSIYSTFTNMRDKSGQLVMSSYLHIRWPLRWPKRKDFTLHYRDRGSGRS